MIRKGLSVFLALILLLPAALAEGTAGKDPETGLEYFKVRHGSRESQKIAITMDDVNERQTENQTLRNLLDQWEKLEKNFSTVTTGAITLT